MSLDEGLRIEGRGHQMNSKVKIVKQGESNCILDTKLELQAKSQCDLRPAPPGPLYRWPGLRVLVGCDTNSWAMSVYIVVSIFDSIVIWLLSWAIIFMGLNPNIN
jgi:hypothetical protein